MLSQSRRVSLAAGTVIALAVALGLGCFRSEGGSESASADPLPTYTEGGALTLQVNGLPLSIPITNALFLNTDEGYPDYIELKGPQTYILAQVDNKIHDGSDGLSDYKPILNKPQPLTHEKAEEPLKVNVPNAGAYPITGGHVTLTKYDHGMEGRVMWEGNIQLEVQSAAGPATLPGTFKFGIVPVW